MSFSDKRVADVVNSKFVAAWTNRGPGFFNKEFWAEKDILDRNYEMYPTKNICTFFLTPDRKVFYYAAGSYSPDMFLKILETATSLRAALFDEKMEPKDKGLADAAKVHAEKAEAYQDLSTKAEDPKQWHSLVSPFRTVAYRGIKHVHSEACAWCLKEGYGYLSKLHREWAARTELPAIDEVRYKYLYGNEFTEETGDSTHIAKPEEPPPPPPGPVKPKAPKIEAQFSKDLYCINTPRAKPGVSLFGQ